jgi:hypothetical protein
MQLIPFLANQRQTDRHKNTHTHTHKAMNLTNIGMAFYFSVKPTDALVSKFILVQNSTCLGSFSTHHRKVICYDALSYGRKNRYGTIGTSPIMQLRVYLNHATLQPHFCVRYQLKHLRGVDTFVTTV